MFMFTRYLYLLASLLSSVWAIPLASRDVVDPPITSPTVGTVWHVGETQTVTWQTTGLPVNQSNPVGMLVLGYLFNNSEHLMLDSPLATKLNYSVGMAQVTVPNVPPRTDYIVVLFGDSGNASPKFTIINDASSSTSAAPPSTPSTPAGSATGGSTPGSTPPAGGPAPASAQTPADLSPSSSAGSSPTHVNGPAATATTPASPTSHSSTVVVVTASSTPSPARSSAAWRKHTPSLGASFGVALAVIYFAFS